MCKQFQAANFCPYGIRCIFIHHDAGEGKRQRERVRMYLQKKKKQEQLAMLHHKNSNTISHWLKNFVSVIGLIYKSF